MAELKTKATTASVGAFLDAVANDQRRADCKRVAKIMQKITGKKPKMWGSSIVGFDSYHYKYATGHEGDCCLVGFSSGKAHLSLYLTSGYETPAMKALLARLGKHKTAVACLYIKRLSDVEMPVLEQLIEQSIAETRKRYSVAES